MAIATNVKDVMNTALKRANLKLDTLTAQKHEAARIRRLLERGHFDRMQIQLHAIDHREQVLVRNVMSGDHVGDGGQVAVEG